MSDRYRGKGPEDHMEDGKPESVEEIYGGTEDFSKRAVGSLFEQEEAEDETPGGVSPTAPRGRRAPGIKRESDSEEQYAKYLEMAHATNQREEERKRKEREETASRHEEQLAELSEVARRRKPPGEAVEEYAYGNPRQGTMPPLNIRNIALIGLFVVLAVFVVLIIMMNSAWSDTAAANQRIEVLQGEIAALTAVNEELAAELKELEYELAGLEFEMKDLLASLANLTAPTLPANGPNQGTAETGSTPPAASTPAPTTPNLFPNMTLNAAGQRVYTVQETDTGFWALAVRFFGDGSRYPDILAANNLESNVLRPGMTLIIPD